MHKKYALVAVCQLNQWAMSFTKNKANIVQSIQKCKQQGVSYRLGPEMEVPGYSCEDHFFEPDTEMHSWEVLRDILADPELTKDILCDIGMPVVYQGTLYNCRMFCLNQEIILIRPKLYMAHGDNYRESRWFKPWKHGYELHDFQLPFGIQSIKGQKVAPIGIAMVQCRDTIIASEICEEIWVIKNPHADFCMAGAEIISNASGSHHQLRKLNTRLNLIQNCSLRNNCVYMYSNLKGCDGTRLYFDGSSMITMNGSIFAQAEQFSIDDVDVEVAVLDLDQVRAARLANHSRVSQTGEQSPQKIPRVYADIEISRQITSISQISRPFDCRIIDPMQEIAGGPALWLWDQLRRTGARGFFLPLSGGADSSSTAAIVASMAIFVFNSIQAGNQDTLATIRKVVRKEDFTPTKYQDIVAEVFVTAYLGTKNSGNETRERARKLSEGIGAQHHYVNIDKIYDAFLDVFEDTVGKRPDYVQNGGSYTEDLALQNIQARSRMVVSYLLGQLTPWANGQQGFLLVLGSANIAEGLRGYMTKYDCSSADLNPIGGINKTDIKSFLTYFGNQQNLPVLVDVANALPTAELRPHDGKDETTQLDEEEMGMTYNELDEFGRLRKIQYMGPFTMFEHLLFKWNGQVDPLTHVPMTPTIIAQKVKRFFVHYSRNRHKMTVITPAYHCEAYGNDDNRFDHRQFLYDSTWEHQFAKIDSLVEIISQSLENEAGAKM